MIRSRLVQELRHGLIWRLAEADNPARPVLEGFVRRMEAAVPEGESWLRLENVPVWEPREEMTWVVGSEVNSIAWAPESAPPEWRDWVAAGCEDGMVRLWNSRTRLLKELRGHSGVVTSVAFSPDGLRLASGSHDRTVRLWELATKGEVSPVTVFEGHSEAVTSVAFRPDGHRLASGSLDGTVGLWELEGGDNTEPIVGNFKSFSCPILFVTYSPDGRRLATGSGNGMVTLWDFASSDNILFFPSQSAAVTSLAFSPDGRLSSGSNDGIVRLSDVEKRSKVTYGVGSGTGLVDCGSVFFVNVATVELRQSRQFDSVRSVAISPNRCRLACGSDDSALRLWDLDSEKNAEPVVFEGHYCGITSVAFSPNGRLLASGSRDKTVRLWDLDSEKNAGPVVSESHSCGITAVAFSPNGRRLASGSGDKSVRLWDLEKGGNAHSVVFEGHSDPVHSLAFSPDGLRLACGFCDRKVWIWDLDRGGNCEPFDCFRLVHSLAFSPDGRWLAIGSSAGIVELRHFEKLEPCFYGDKSLAALTLHKSASRTDNERVRSVTFSPDGRWLACGSSIGIVTLWDRSHRTIARTILTNGHSDWNTSVVFSPDGRRLATGAADRTIRVLDLDFTGFFDSDYVAFEGAAPILALGTDPERPSHIFAACSAQIAKIHFPVVYSLRLVTGPFRPAATSPQKSAAPKRRTRKARK